MQRTPRGCRLRAVGRAFGIWALAGGALGALFGGRVVTGCWCIGAAGRVLVSGAGFVLEGRLCWG